MSQDLPTLGKSGSEVSNFIPEPGKCSEVIKFSYNIKKPWLKATQKGIKNIMNNQTFLVQDSEKGDPVTPCIDFENAKIQSDGSIDKLKLRIVVRGDLQNTELFGETSSPTSSMRTLK